MEITENEINELSSRLSELKKEIQKKIVGQHKTVDQLLITFMAGGHALLEGVPGLAKTLLIRSLAEAILLNFKRIQFTPDLMPSDIIGTEVLEEDHATGKRFFKFIKGPVFANIILADEINRTPPKTQAALLEAMQEFEVTYAGQTYAMDKPFFILATQNPIEQAGTFPLPEAQLDRFLMYIKIDYPGEEEELAILTSTTGIATEKLVPVMRAEEIIRTQQIVRQVIIHEDLIRYINQMVRATRPNDSGHDYVKEWVKWGAGPRAGQAMVLTAKANAFLNSRLSVTLEDIKSVAYPVLRHRILMNFKAEAEQIDADAVTSYLLEKIKFPKSALG